MIPRARKSIGLTLSVLGIGAFALLLAFALMRLSDIERDMRVEATQNMLWVISQAQVSTVLLSDTIAQYALGQTDSRELQRRYDVFVSRIALLEAGPQRRQMERLGYLSELDALARATERLDPLLDRLKNGDLTPVAEANGVLEPQARTLGRAANAAMVAEWDGLGARLDTYRVQLWHIIASLAGISLIGSLISLRLLLALRETTKRSHLLRSEKAFSELVIGSSGEGILAVDLQQRCTVWNAAMEHLFGVPQDIAAGSNLADISGFFNIEAVRQALALARQGTSATLFDQVYFPSGGDEPLYLFLRCFPLRREDDIMGVIVFVSDVTERRSVQVELSRHRDHLEELVKARTRELDEALGRERAAADLYRNFAAMVSHQFRTPLAIVDSALQRLMRRRKSMTPVELKERAGKARQAIMRLTGLVESTLDAARLDAGQIVVRTQACDIAELARSVCERQIEVSPERDVVLRNEACGPVAVHCDPTHAENILINLVSNAVKYSPADTPVIVTISNDSALGRCTVGNRAIGFDPSESENVFERNYRGANANGLPGVGIGLYMARTLARMQDGDVKLVRSAHDEIAFCLSLPLTCLEPRAPTERTGARLPEAVID